MIVYPWVAPEDRGRGFGRVALCSRNGCPSGGTMLVTWDRYSLPDRMCRRHADLMRAWATVTK